ncbi:putative 2-oxoglutarate-dependent dioxygenase [Cocos nucifera]|uniref:Putative 2-oxoglutarate-dependent dioxygenase n=1 Tax=Cocos nucifera TaxID=13894 RepID=A0A8K0II31_COCNU|nr:putative 2-oxoglutarate-dependent dioxygenase [Cocos nucifera]
MGSDFKTIPVIDIGPLVEKIDDPKMANDPEVKEVIRMLDKACKDAGFFYVKGHGIADSLVKEVRDITHKFFGLPYEDKLKIKMTPASGYRGYQRIGENITKGKPDMHEAIDCYREIEPGTYGTLGKPLEGSNLWPDYPSHFKELMEEYLCLLRDLSRKIMHGIALALGGSADAFEGLLTLVNQDDDIHALEVLDVATQVPGLYRYPLGQDLEIFSFSICTPKIRSGFDLEVLQNAF